MNISILSKTMGALAVAALTFSAASVFAAAGQTSGSLNLDKTGTLFSIGNSNAGGKLWTTGRVASTHSATNASQQHSSMIDLDASFLKKTFKIIDIDSSIVYNHTSAANGSWTNNYNMNGGIKILGLGTYTPTWTKNGQQHIGDTGVKEFPVTFFSASASYPVGPVTLTVSGNVGGALNFRAYVKKDFVNNSTYLQEFGQTYVTSGARIDGTGSAKASIVVAGAGIRAKVNIVNGWVTAEGWADRIEYWNNPTATKVLYRGNLNSDASASMGAGKLTLFVEIGTDICLPIVGCIDLSIDAYEDTIASWGGINLASKKLYTQAKEDYFAK